MRRGLKDVNVDEPGGCRMSRCSLSPSKSVERALGQSTLHRAAGRSRSLSPRQTSGSDSTMSQDSKAKDNKHSCTGEFKCTQAKRHQFREIVQYVVDLLHSVPRGRIKLSTCGIALRHKFPGFKVKSYCQRHAIDPESTRCYGFRKFQELMKAIPQVKCVTTTTSGREYVELKDKSGLVASLRFARNSRSSSPQTYTTWNNHKRFWELAHARRPQEAAAPFQQVAVRQRVGQPVVRVPQSMPVRTPYPQQLTSPSRYRFDVVPGQYSIPNTGPQVTQVLQVAPVAVPCAMCCQCSSALLSPQQQPLPVAAHPVPQTVFHSQQGLKLQTRYYNSWQPGSFYPPVMHQTYKAAAPVYDSVRYVNHPQTTSARSARAYSPY